MEIPKIKLENGKGYKDYLKENEMDFWDMTIKAVKVLSNTPDLDYYTAFILYGGNLKKEKDFIVQREKIMPTLNKGLKIMEAKEEYEMCSMILELKEKFEPDK